MHLLMANSVIQLSVQFGCEIHPLIVLVRTSDQMSRNLTGVYHSVGICFFQTVSKSGSPIGFMFDAPGLTSVVIKLVSVSPVKTISSMRSAISRGIFFVFDNKELN